MAKSIPGLVAVRMRVRANGGKESVAPKLAGSFYKFMLEKPPVDFLASGPDAPPHHPDVPKAKAAKRSESEPYVLMHMRELGPQVVIPEPTTAVDVAHTPTDAPSMGPLGAATETTPDEFSDVTGLMERLSLPGAVSNSNGAGKGEGAQGITQALKDTCDFCGKHGVGFKRCSTCKQTWYCGAACQTAAWKRHKKSLWV